MQTQKIEIEYQANDNADNVRILHVWTTGKELIVSAKQNNSFFGYGDRVKLHDSVSIQVEKEMPVKFYFIGIEENSCSYADVHCISQESEIPEHERTACLYENEMTDLKERVALILRQTKQIEDMSIWKHYRFAVPQKLTAILNDKKAVRTIINQDSHSLEEQIALEMLHLKYDQTTSQHPNYSLPNDEANIVLANFYLTIEDGERLESLFKKYEKLLEQHKENVFGNQLVKDRKEQQTAIQQPFANSGMLKNFGIFAAAAIAITTVAATAYTMTHK